MGRDSYSKIVAVDIINHAFLHMKEKLAAKIITRRYKVNALVDDFTRLGHKTTLIVILKASADGETAIVGFPLHLIELETLYASTLYTFHLKARIMDRSLINGFTIDLLQQMFARFCGDGANWEQNHKLERPIS